MKNEPQLPATGKKGPSSLITFIVCIIILSMATHVSLALKNSRQKNKRKQSVEKSIYVEIITTNASSQEIIVHATGTVTPSRELKIKSQVAGEIIHIHSNLLEGALISAETEIITIDPVDYELAIIKSQREVANASYALKLEQGHQDIARQEWFMIQKDAHSSADKSLVLRKPHLAKAKADLSAAKSDLKKAKRMLEKTHIKIPFNAYVRNKHIEIGAQVSSQETLVELVGTDTFWIQVSLPLDRLKYLNTSGKNIKEGTTATITYREQFSATGEMVRLLGELESQGHMAQLIIEVDKPFTLDPPLLIGEYVRVRLMGKTIQNACRIPRVALRNNNTVWLVSSGSRLKIQSVNVAFRDMNDVIITDGLNSGDQVIVSEISAPVDGMNVYLTK